LEPKQGVKGFFVKGRRSRAIKKVMRAVIFGDSSVKWTVLQRITAFGGIERGIPTVDPKGDQ
jgi:hypothetical protein